MKNTSLKYILLTLSALSAAGHSGIAPAHDKTGALGTNEHATDLYQVTCASDAGGATAKLVMQVKDNAPAAAPRVSVQVIKGKLARNATDNGDGDANFSSPAIVNGGNGAYLVAVDKTAAGSESYALEFHCQASSGAHTDTSIATLQNQ
jgi:hypothetical protein